MSSEIREQLARMVHEAWLKEREKQGFVPPIPGKCPTCGSQQTMTNDASIIFCTKGCPPLKTHQRMLPYDDLSEDEKGYNRASVAGVIEALKALGYDIVDSKTGFVVNI